MTVVRFLLLAGLAELSGLALLSRFSRDRRSGPGALGLAFVVGALGLGLWTHFMLFVRIPVTSGSVIVGGLALLAVVRRPFFKELVWKRPPWTAWLLAPAAALLLYGASSFSLIGVDPATFYSLKGKSIATYGTFWNEDFTDPARLHPCRRRPLLLPSMYANVYLVTGSDRG